jgi:ubiquinone/menaquinone biosynthesis C-methylase UbiE
VISRVLEEEVMTGAAAQQYDEMDHSEANSSFVSDLVQAASLGDESRGEESDASEKADDSDDDVWLDVGTGTAMIPILFCQTLPDAKVLASDFSTDMLDLARYRIEVDGLITRIQLSQDDAKLLGYSDDMFIGVMSNSIVHHIPEPQSVLSEAVRVTQPGGVLFFRDLARPSDEATLSQLVATYAGQETTEARSLFAESLRAALTIDEIRHLVQGLGFSPDSVQMTSDRHWTWFARKPSH